MKERAAAIAMLVALAGCASLDSDQCARGDWYGIGRMDGLNGKGADRIEDHRSACRKFAPPNEREYERGRHDGLKIWCAHQDGHAISSSEERFDHPCTGTIATEFDEGYYRKMLEDEEARKKKAGGW
jgi:hypothetical protein